MVDIVRGLVTATLSINLAPNTREFSEPQEADTVPPGDSDHHKLPVLPVSKLCRYSVKKLTIVEVPTHVSLYVDLKLYVEGPRRILSIANAPLCLSVNCHHPNCTAEL